MIVKYLQDNCYFLTFPDWYDEIWLGFTGSHIGTLQKL